VRRTVVAVLTAVVTALAGCLVVGQAQGVQIPQDRIVSDDPANFTPRVLDGSVKSIQQLGDLILIGGDFTQIQAANGGTILTRRGLAAFNATTGAISTAFAPNPDGEVTTIIPAADGTSVYVGGSFNTISGASSPSLARISATTGARITTFVAPTLSGRIKDLRLVGNRLWLAGTFTHVAGRSQAALATVNATTGAFDPHMSLVVAGVHNGGNTTVIKMDVTPDGRALVAIGNFLTVGGLSRRQAFMLNISGASAAVENWQTNFYSSTCSSSFQTYMRDLDISPDGRYFVISTTGAYRGSTVACDTSARWEVAARGTGLVATWINHTGGDTQYAVAITGTVVYIGGHARWQNNPFAGDRAGEGAVSRPGIAALDPVNGLPFSWNPTRERGVGVFDLLSTPTGLWVGSDTEHLGENFEFRPRIAFFPLAGGTVVTSNNTPTLPNNVYVAGRRGLVTFDDTLSRSSYDGTTASPLASISNGGIAWRNNRGAFMLNGQLYSGWSDGSFNQRSYNGTSFGAATPVNTGDLLVNMATWHNEVASITGMFFDNGRLYYTLSGQTSLFYRYFTPESNVVGAARYTASPSVTGINFSQVNGMFLAGSTLYWARSTDGTLHRMSWNSTAGAPVAGTAQTLSTGIDWRSRTLFLFQGPFTAPNQPPTAAFSVTCTALTCSVDGSAASDTDGTIASYAWTFGDGGTATGRTASHTYAANGTYTIGLTVTDNDGAGGSTTRQVIVSATAAGIAFVGSGGVNVNASQFTVTVPAAVQPGDSLLLFFADNDAAPAITGPAGWTLRQSVASTSQAGRFWHKIAASGDAGSQVRVTTSAFTKADLTLVAYTGTSSTTPIAGSAAGSETVSRTAHTTPAVTSAVNGVRLVSYWGEESSSTTTLTAPAGVTARESSTGSGSGRITALAADSGSYPAGTIPGVTATANAASARVMMFSVALAPAG